MIDGEGTAKPSDAPDPLIGRVIAGRFTIVSLIARGGMGKVYRAEQAPLGRVCAVKILHPRYSGDSDPEFQRRFYREASITSKITHPNSVTIFDYGKTDDDIYFMAMEYLEGQTLHQALRQGGVMSEYRVGRITSQICRALREAHALGVIHRDLKPANIFLTRPGARAADASDPPLPEEEDFVKVLDFGLVKHLAERPEEQLTQTGLFMGSPKYMAPEQIQSGTVDARTDIYSLGIIMYEMLAGKVPFERATSVNTLMAHVGEAPPPMRAVNPNLVCSPAFEELVMSCIAKDPNQRLASMDQLLQAIRRLHGGAATGQLAALSSGPYSADGSGPVSGVRAGASGPIASIGSDLALGNPASEPPRAPPHEHHAAAQSIERPAPSRARWWILAGVLIAAAAGAVLGLLAFHLSGGATARSLGPATASPTIQEPAPAISVASPSTAVTAEPSAVPVPTLAITTEPAGASVREGDRELCASTPCEVVFAVTPADLTKTRKLVLARRGYRTETRYVTATDRALDVKLTPTAHRPAPTPTQRTAPDGFKEAPY